MIMRKTLVVYFSRSGHTRSVADEIARRCGADLEAIQDVRPRTGVFGYWRSAREAMKKTIIEIRPSTRDPAEYDLVILGTPIWGGNLCSPMRAYVSGHRGKFRQVAFFSTQGGSPPGKAFRDLAELCACAPRAVVAITDKQMQTGALSGKVDEFVRALALPHST